MKNRRLVLSSLALGLVTILSSCGSASNTGSTTTPNNSSPLNHNSNNKPVTPVTGVLSDSKPGFNDNNLEINNPNEGYNQLNNNTSDKNTSLDSYQPEFDLLHIKKELASKQSDLQPGSSNSNTINKTTDQKTTNDAGQNNSKNSDKVTDTIHKPTDNAQTHNLGLNGHAIQTIDSKNTVTHAIAEDHNDHTTVTNPNTIDPIDNKLVGSKTPNTDNSENTNASSKKDSVGKNTNTSINQGQTTTGQTTTDQTDPKDQSKETTTSDTVTTPPVVSTRPVPESKEATPVLPNAPKHALNKPTDSVATRPQGSSADPSDNGSSTSDNSSSSSSATTEASNPKPTSASSAATSDSTPPTRPKKPAYNLVYYPNIQTTNTFNSVNTLDINNTNVDTTKPYNIDLDDNDFSEANRQIRVYQADNSFFMSFNDFIKKTLNSNIIAAQNANTINFLELYMSGFANVYTKQNIPVSSHLAITSNSIIRVQVPSGNLARSYTVNSAVSSINTNKVPLANSYPSSSDTASTYSNSYNGSHFDRSSNIHTSQLEKNNVIVYNIKDSEGLDATTASTLSKTLYNIKNDINLNDNTSTHRIQNVNQVPTKLATVKESTVASSTNSMVTSSIDTTTTAYNLKSDASSSQNLIIDGSAANATLGAINEETFTGKNVKVAIIDGDFNLDSIDNAQSAWNLKPKTINITDLNHYGSKELDSSIHALIVGSTLTGKRQSPDMKTTVGVASNAQLYTASIWGSALFLGEVYHRIYTNYHPTVINNSIYISKPYNEAISADSGASRDNVNRDNYGRDATAEGLSSISQRRHISTASYYDSDYYGQSFDTYSSYNPKYNSKYYNDYDNSYDYNEFPAEFDDTRPQGLTIADNALQTSGLATQGFDVYNSNFWEYNPNRVDPETNSYISDKKTADYDKLEKSPNIFASLEAGLHTISNSAHAPLIVFSAGNIGIPDFIANYKNMTTDQIVESIKDKNFGFKLDKDSVVSTLLRDPDIRKNFLVVTGGYGDPNRTKQLGIFNYKLNLLRQNIKATNGDQANLSDDELIKKYGLTRPSTIIPTGLNTDDIISSPNAYQCGVVMYDCVTAGFDYFSYIKSLKLNNVRNVKTDDLVEQGTSFSAPVVSGLAAILKQQFPWMSASNLKTTILTTATDIGAPGVDPVFGWGFINAALALKGPQMFAFGDFIANLSGQDSAGYLEDQNKPFISNPSLRNNYYFINNISGKGGLVVDGNYNDFLYLTGINTYKGNTIINGGHLVVEDPYSLGFYNYTYSQNYGIASLDSNVYVNNRGFLTARNARLASVANNGIVELDNTHITGDYTQSDNAILIFDDLNQSSVDGNVSLGNTGTIILKHNNPNVNFVPLEGKYYVLLNSKNLSGHFAKQVVLDDKPLLQYQVLYSKNPGLITLNIAPAAVTSAVRSIISDDTAKDQTALNSGLWGLESLNKRANALFKLNNSKQTYLRLSSSDTSINDQTNNDQTNNDQTTAISSNVLNAATYVQNLDSTQLKHFLYTTANTIYPDVQLASSTQVRQAFNDFSSSVNSKFAKLSNQGVSAYLDYSYNNTTWSNQFYDQSNIFGKQILSSTTLGIYGQYRGLNLGLGANFQTSSWHENLATNQDQANSSNLASSKNKAYGINLVLGRALADSTYAFSAFTSYQNFDVQRSTFFANDQTSKLRTLDFGIKFDYQKQILATEHSGIVINTNVNLIDHYQFKFTEQSTGSDQVARGMSSVYQLNAQSKHNLSSFVNLGLKTYYSFNILNTTNKISAKVNVEQALVAPNYNLNLIVNDAKISQTTNSILQSNTIGTLSLKYSVELIKDLNIDLSTSYTLSNSWTNKAVKLALTYKF